MARACDIAGGPKLYWFKGTTDEAGNILTLEPALRREEDGGLVFFVEARDPKHAEKLVLNRYHRKIQKARHARLKREGLCRCGKPNDSGTGSRCKACKKRDSKYAKRQRAKARGEEVPVLNRIESLKLRRASDADALRLAVLVEAHRRYFAKGSFIEWLEAEIRKIGGKSALAKLIGKDAA